MAESKWRKFWTKFDVFRSHCTKNDYKGVFEVADYDSKVENEKLKMADSIWLEFLTKFDVLHLNCPKMNIKILTYEKCIHIWCKRVCARTYVHIHTRVYVCVRACVRIRMFSQLYEYFQC